MQDTMGDVDTAIQHSLDHSYETGLGGSILCLNISDDFGVDFAKE